MKKQDFIILIGSDGAGKSTIAEELNKALGYPVEHHGSVKSYFDGKQEYFNSIYNTNYSVIKDRFHEGEKIFAPLYRGYEADYFDELERELKYRFNVLLVLVNAPFITILNRISVRGEDYVKPEHIEYCYNKVTDIFNESTLPKMMIDTTMFTPSENVEKIIKLL